MGNMNIKKLLLPLLAIILLTTVFGINTYASIVKAKATPNTQIKPQVANSVILNGDGTVRIFGTKVTGVNGDILTTESEINGKQISFTVNTNNTTKILTSNTNTTVSGIPTGSIILVTGIFQSFDPTLTVFATEIRVRNDVPELKVEEATTTVVTDETASTTTEEVITPEVTVPTTTEEIIEEPTPTPTIIETIQETAQTVVDTVTETVNNVVDAVTSEPEQAPTPEVTETGGN